MRGRFVVFEGIDGTGKSTCIRAVADAFEVQTTREETTTERGDWIRQSIREHWDPLTTTHLFVADRAQHIHDIEAWLDAGQHVVCDRFMHSTLAYQSVTLADRLPDPMTYLRNLHHGWCPQPDAVVLLTAPPEVTVARTQARGEEASRYEKVEFLARVQEAYLQLAKEDGMIVLDANRPAQEVAADAVDALRPLLG